MTLFKKLSSRKEYLIDVIKEKEKSLKRAPDGFVKISTRKNGYQYYHRENRDDKNGVYIRKSNYRLAEALGQKEYDRRILEAAQSELNRIQSLERFYKQSKYAERVFGKLPASYQHIVAPIQESNEEFLNRWLNTEYEGLKFEEGDPEFYSGKGERMRSKSEVLIADMLTRYGIPYLYEKPLYLKGYGYVHPDFTLLDLRTRREVYLEHMGMMDDIDYVVKSLNKIALYEANGYELGEQLIITFETLRQPLNMKSVERKIQKLVKFKDCDELGYN